MPLIKRLKQLIIKQLSFISETNGGVRACADVWLLLTAFRREEPAIENSPGRRVPRG